MSALQILRNNLLKLEKVSQITLSVSLIHEVQDIFQTFWKALPMLQQLHSSKITTITHHLSKYRKQYGGAALIAAITATIAAMRRDKKLLKAAGAIKKLTQQLHSRLPHVSLRVIVPTAAVLIFGAFFFAKLNESNKVDVLSGTENQRRSSEEYDIYSSKRREKHVYRQQMHEKRSNVLARADFSDAVLA